MLKACIFDLDGVLTDTAEFHYRAWKHMAAALPYDLTAKDNEKLKGVSRSDSLDLILQWAGMDNNAIDQAMKNQLMAEKNKYYLELVDTLNAKDLFPGVLEFFAQLKQNGIKIGLGSSSKNAVHILKKLGILEWFDAISDGNNFVNGKPHPDVFIAAAQMLHEIPDECLVFEDAQSGVEAALSAGMKCIGVGNDAQLHGVVCQINGLQEADLDQFLELYR